MAEKHMDEEEFVFPDEKAEEAPATEVAADAEVEVVDDAPEQDRGRAPINKTADEIAPDDEVEEYSEKVQKRIKEMKRAWHDERRAKEEQARIADEAVRTARLYYEQAQRAQQGFAASQKQSFEQMKSAAEAELSAAEQELEAAYESGDSKRVVKATKAVNEAQFKIARASAMLTAPQPQAPSPLQPTQQGVQPAPTVQAPQPSQRDLDWKSKNAWFGNDEEMTSFALGLHQKLVKEGLVPGSEAYYTRVDKRMREVFPTNFDDGEAESPPPKKSPPATVVAPASRASTAPKKLTITKSQKALAEKLGISVQEYARQVQLLEQRKNG